MKHMGTIPVSYTELARQGVLALRGLGYSFSIAERAAHTLATTEAVTGLGLKCLQASAQRIEATAATSLTAATAATGVTVVNAGGKSLLELSPFLLDVASGDAERFGRSAVLVDDVDGMPFLADIALRAATHGLAIWVTYSSRKEPQSLAARPASFTVRDRRISGRPLADPATVWQRTGERLEASPLASIIPSLSAPVREGTGRVLIVGGKAGADLGMLETEGDAAAADWQLADTWQRAFDRAIQGHIDAEMTGFDFFYKCVKRAWAPTSDRSRGQQG